MQKKKIILTIGAIALGAAAGAILADHFGYRPRHLIIDPFDDDFDPEFDADDEHEDDFCGE